VSSLRQRVRELDQACADAVDLARSAAEEEAGPGQVGPHVAVEAEGDRVCTHLFTCLDPAYVGWRWAVTVARASRAKSVTVSESVLLPGPDSLLAPDWVPWRDRVRPGDLGVGDLMPAHPDDERLVPATLLEGDEGLLDWDDGPAWAGAWGREGEPPGAVTGTSEAGAPPASAAAAQAGAAVQEDGPGQAGAAARAEEVGQPAEATHAAPLAGVAGRAADPVSAPSRVLSVIGRDETALRWYSGDHGPRSPLAHAAPAPCMTCGFLVRLGGPLGRVFGVCANEYAPDDGRVVSLDHGCGAHSEAGHDEGAYAAASPVIDELGYDLVDMPGVSMDETVFESLDHT
jgi:hypothetical protein